MCTISWAYFSYIVSRVYRHVEHIKRLCGRACSPIRKALNMKRPRAHAPSEQETDADQQLWRGPYDMVELIPLVQCVIVIIVSVIVMAVTAEFVSESCPGSFR